MRVFGISRDPPYTLVAWAQALDFGDLPLLSDFNGDAVRGFGIGHVLNGMRDVARRTAFLVDRGGTVRGAWAYDSSELPDFDELLEAGRSLAEQH